MEEQSVTIIGPGAIGCALAGALVSGGHDPVLVARTPFDRLRVGWEGGSVDTEVTCITDPGDLQPANMVIVATKATQNAAVAEHLAASIGPGTVVVVAQNGIDHLERFSPELTAGATVLGAVVFLPAERQGPGNVEVGRSGRLVVPRGPGAAELEELFAGSFVRIESTDDWTTSAWLKLMINAPSGGMSVLAGRGSEIFTDEQAQALLLALMEEVAAVGRADGADLPADLPAKMCQRHAANAGGHMTSIVLDRLAGMPTEWRERNEIVVRRGREHGVDTPLNEALVTLLRLGEPDELWAAGQQTG